MMDAGSQTFEEAVRVGELIAERDRLREALEKIAEHERTSKPGGWVEHLARAALEEE